MFSSYIFVYQYLQFFCKTCNYIFREEWILVKLPVCLSLDFADEMALKQFERWQRNISLSR